MFYLKKIWTLLWHNFYFKNIILTLFSFLILKIIFFCINALKKNITLSEKQTYTFHKRNKTLFNIILLITILIIWREVINNVITFISFVSAAITLAIRDIIYNYFCGIYIKIIKPFSLEDRIKVGSTIGDVININSLSFELLDVCNETNQSTGKIIHIPNSQIFSNNIENYNTAFKYIWDEIDLTISPNSNILLAKNILENIIKENIIIASIPAKMQKEIKKANTNYRIYFNKLSPIIYTKILDNKVILTARFLMHPKKIRMVESDIYEQIIKEFKDKFIFFA